MWDDQPATCPGLRGFRNSPQQARISVTTGQVLFPDIDLSHGHDRRSTDLRTAADMTSVARDTIVIHSFRHQSHQSGVAFGSSRWAQLSSLPIILNSDQRDLGVQTQGRTMLEGPLGWGLSHSKSWPHHWALGILRQLLYFIKPQCFHLHNSISFHGLVWALSELMRFLILCFFIIDPPRVF